MRRNSDNNLYELEYNVWDEFAQSDDCIVPHQNDERVNKLVVSGVAPKKSWHVEKDVGKSKDSGRLSQTVSRSKETYSISPMNDGRPIGQENSWSLASGIALASQDAKISDSCIKDCNTEIDSNAFPVKSPVPGTMGLTNDCKDCQSPHDHVSPGVTNHNLYESEHKDRENDFMYYDWPDIGSFEDIDGILRNCDSAFGQGCIDNANELSWFPSSSPTICGSEVTFEQGLQSPCSEFSVLNKTSGHHSANANFLPQGTQLHQPSLGYDMTSNVAYQISGDCMDISAENSQNPTNKDQVYTGVEETKTPARSQIHYENGSSGCKSFDVMGSQPSTEENVMQQFIDQKISSSSALAPNGYPSQHFSNQNHYMGSASSCYMDTHSSRSQSEYSFPPHQIQTTQTTWSKKYKNKKDPSFSNSAPQGMERSNHMSRPSTLTPLEKMEKLQNRQKLCVTMNAEDLSQAAFISKATIPAKDHKSQHEIAGGSKQESRSLGIAHSSVVQENSLVTSVSSNDSSVEATSLRRLQDAMDQLDVRTKLCIRDSLYRLARSAKERHSFPSTSNFSRESGGARRIQNAEASNNCADFSDVETETNPIDRSIAHLLFHRPSDPLTRSADDVTSLESHIINGQTRVHATSHAAMPDVFAPQRQFGDQGDMNMLFNDQH